VRLSRLAGCSKFYQNVGLSLKLLWFSKLVWNIGKKKSRYLFNLPSGFEAKVAARNPQITNSNPIVVVKEMYASRPQLQSFIAFRSVGSGFLHEQLQHLLK